MAFVGGTGVLTFIDLVSLLAKVNLGIINPDEVPILGKGSTFRFVLYVSFRNRRDSIALQFLEDFDKLCKSKGWDNFKLVLRISDGMSRGRWDDDFISQAISKLRRENLNRVYVCGPPAMNEVFDRSLERLINRGTLRRSEVEIM